MVKKKSGETRIFFVLNAGLKSVFALQTYDFALDFNLGGRIELRTEI